ncbi:hypothetical protein [Flavobacterium sp.]|uniref:hypothetical protein n=1 Tax=Flavobacterium sp. TaxID=239 RepID=UPI0026343751|nr:hypothetical protein [Flavobacterium sp.]
MNKLLIIYMPLMILCMLKLKQLKKMLKQMLLFFVLQIQEIEFVFKIAEKALKYSNLQFLVLEIQFFVSGSGFSVLVPAPDKFNSLYSALDSLKIKQ